MPSGRKNHSTSTGFFGGSRVVPERRATAPREPLPDPPGRFSRAPTPAATQTTSRTTARPVEEAAPASPPAESPVRPDMLTMLLRPDLSLQELSDAVGSIPRLEGVLLHAARSAAPRTTAQALLALGQAEAAVLSILHLIRLHFASTVSSFSPDPMLARCLRRGVISMHLAERLDTTSPVEAFALGLLQDLGSLQLSHRLPHLAAAIEALQRHAGPSRREAELLLTGRDHIGELLSSPLGGQLSEPLRDAISTHHGPDHPLAMLAWATDAIADMVQVGDAARPAAEAALRELGLKESLSAILEDTALAAQRLARPIRLPLMSAELTQRGQGMVDSLSGLSNHGQLTRQLDDILARARKSRRQVSVILINIDSFHLVNEFYGHPAGDLLLRTIAGRLRDCTRLGDQLGRLGGDAFCLILSDTSSTGGQVVAERLRAMVERTELPMGDVRAGCSISLCGMTVSADAQPGAASLIQTLETELASARGQGRNRVCWLDGSGSS
jgi:diguanylate cyclase (GGDEF)-like protein